MGISLASAYLAARAIRRRLIRGRNGPVVPLADVALVVAVITLVAESLGAVGLFKTGPLTAALVVVGLAALSYDRAFPSSATPATPRGQEQSLLGRAAFTGRRPTAVAIGAASVVLADWGARVASAYRGGMTGVDTVWYHMPFAARFAQTGSLTALHYVDPEPVTVFFPANSELLHGAGILMMGSDVLSPLINVGWLLVAFLASWCIGRRFRVAPLALMASAALFGTPGLVATQAGEAYTDVVGLALWLSSIALLVSLWDRSAPDRFRALVVSAVPAGLAFGTKFTFVAPVVALVVGVAAISLRGTRLKSLVVMAATVVLVGSYWYLRNLFAVGNPLPSLAHLGPISLPSPPVSTPTSTVAHFLFDGRYWSKYFLPGFRLSLGPLWWAIGALMVVGMLSAVLPRCTVVQRMLGAVAAVAGLAFVLTPQFLTNYGVPYFFEYNLRYSFAAVLLALALAPTLAWIGTRRRQWIMSLVLAAVVVGTQSDATLWPWAFKGDRFAVPVGGINAWIGVMIGITGFAAGIAVLFWRNPRHARAVRGIGARRAVLIGVGCAVAAVVMGSLVQQRYLEGRYADLLPVPRAYSWAQNLHNARIGVFGLFSNLQYPFYGRDLSNYVQFIGFPEPDGSFKRVSSCAEWIRAIKGENLDYVFITTGLVGSRAALRTNPPESGWLLDGSGSRLIGSGVRVAKVSGKTVLNGYFTFRIDRSLQLRCPGAHPVDLRSAEEHHRETLRTP